MNSERPADLPEFKMPPLTEVVLGAQFDAIQGFQTPHLGLIWQQFRAAFPIIEEHPPLQPTFETFGLNPEFVTGFQFSLVPHAPRLFFVNDARTELVQVQQDRFLHNWRKVVSDDNYPRFEPMLQTFADGLSIYVDTIVAAGLQAPTPNQCEITYINQIPVAKDQSLSELTADLFGQHTGNLMLENLGEPEDLRFMLRYTMRDAEGAPFGRLIAAAEPARRADGSVIIQLTMTARGRPLSRDVNGINEFFNRGRVAVVKTFTHLTGPKMHKLWERTQ